MIQISFIYNIFQTQIILMLTFFRTDSFKCFLLPPISFIRICFFISNLLELPVCLNAWMKVYMYTDMKVCKYTNWQVDNYASMQVGKLYIKVSKYQSMQVHKYSHMQVCKHVNIHACWQLCKFHVCICNFKSVKPFVFTNMRWFMSTFCLTKRKT